MSGHRFEGRIARRAAQCDALGAGLGRGARFACTLNGASLPRFADLAAVPRWLLLQRAQQERVARVAGLMRHRAAIDRELSGPRLALLADAVGEDLIDAVSAAAQFGSPTNDGALPRPDRIVADGWEMLRRGLPAMLAGEYPEACGDEPARALSERAFDLAMAQ